MPNKPPRPCRHPGCRELTSSGYCDKHRKNNKARGVSQKWNGLYHTSEWRSIRAQHLVEEPFCRECAKQGHRVRGNEVDHIIPHKGNKSLFLDKFNLQTLCKSCHSRKTMAELRGNLKKIH